MSRTQILILILLAISIIGGGAVSLYFILNEKKGDGCVSDYDAAIVTWGEWGGKADNTSICSYVCSDRGKDRTLSKPSSTGLPEYVRITVKDGYELKLVYTKTGRVEYYSKTGRKVREPDISFGGFSSWNFKGDSVKEEDVPDKYQLVLLENIEREDKI